MGEPSKGKDRAMSPMVHICTADNEAVAGMWAGVLEDNDIRCVIRGVNSPMGGIMRAISAFNTPQAICVLEVDAEKAVEILRPFVHPEPEETPPPVK